LCHIVGPLPSFQMCACWLLGFQSFSAIKLKLGTN
jgi:hypothetical protein